jgi:hypothetical protein
MIPETIILPTLPDKVMDPKVFERYQKETIYTLQRMYEEIAGGVNGLLRSNDSVGQEAWIPTVSGTSSAGTGTYAADKQIGWVQRQGIFVDVWFDVTWQAHTGTGNLYLDLPYEVVTSKEKPFVGVIQVNNLTFTGSYCVINAIPDTRRGEIWVCSGSGSSNVAMDTSANIQGHIRYVGKQIERS